MDFNELYKELERIKHDIRAGARDGLRTGAEKIAEAAASKPGSYQGAAGPFPAWAELKQGSSPLLKTGGLKSSINVAESGDSYIISADGYALYHESGTTNIPQRAFLGPALIENKDDVIEEIINAIRSKLP